MKEKGIVMKEKYIPPKRVDGPTPAGGDYAILYTLQPKRDDGLYNAVIAEYKNDGTMVRETFGVVDPE